MKNWIKQLDGLLRGEATKLSALKQGTVEIPAGGMAALIILLGLVYGVCMGSFALFKEGPASWSQFFAATVKVPALFFLTLIVTLPSLYVFNALVGSRLNLISVWRLLIAALAVNLAVLASFGPIVAFFSASTTSYSFMVLLNVAMFAVSGILGLLFLFQTLHRLSLTQNPSPPGINPPPLPPEPENPGMPPMIPGARSDEGALDPLEGRVLGPHVKLVFRCWLIVFALVGSQMSWVLRPFLGNPAVPFTWFRPRGSSFFDALWDHFQNLFR